MPKSAMLNVNWAIASERARSAFTAGMTGMNRWTANGPMSEIEASAKLKSGPGVGLMLSCRGRAPAEARPSLAG
jgi:hypothetical protein